MMRGFPFNHKERTMVRALGFSLLSLLILAEASFAADGYDLDNGKHCIQNKQDENLDFFLPKPTERFGSKGGRLKVWSQDSNALSQANLRAKRLKLKPNGMFLPKYSNAPELCYVLSGRAWAGLVKPTGEPTSVRYVRTGDLLTIPRAWVSWLWNTGSRCLEMLCVAETSDIMRPENYTSFFLAGAMSGDMGGFLHGFAQDILAFSWNLKEAQVKEILESQKERGIVVTKLKAGKKDSLDIERESTNIQSGGDFAFSLLTARPTVEERGGWMTLVDRQRLPVLEEVGLGAFLANLDQSAIFSPQWIGCSQILFVTRGSGRVEMAYPNGSQALKDDVNEGDLIVVPALFPHTLIASEQSGMEWISFFASSTWKSSTLAGSKSAFGDIPPAILEAAFNISVHLGSKIFGHPREEVLMLGFHGSSRA